MVVAFESDPEELRASADLILQEFANGREASRHSQALAALGIAEGGFAPTLGLENL